jgi:hypothetical protein
MLWPTAIPALTSSFHRGDGSSERDYDDAAQSAYCNDREAWTHGLAAPFWLQSSEPGRNCDLSGQDHHQPATSGPDSAQSADRGKDWMQRAQSDDVFRHAGLCSNPLILDRGGQGRRQAIHAPKRPLGTVYSVDVLERRGRAAVWRPRRRGEASWRGRLITCRPGRQGESISLGCARCTAVWITLSR